MKMKERSKNKGSIRARSVSKIYGMLRRTKEKEATTELARNPDKFMRCLFSNPVVAAQANNELVFSPDYWLGHTFPEGKEFIGENGFLSFESAVEGIKSSRKKVIMNIGDSSTSGWDSNITTENKLRRAKGKQVLLPFFTYRTYSDDLREMCSDEFEVINAGVPAHSSIHGYRRLRQLLERFHENGVTLDFVTIYYGNNDCAWNGNIEDRDLLPEQNNSRQRIKAALFDEFVCAKLSTARRLRGQANQKARGDVILTRGTVRDYAANLEKAVRTCREYGTVPVLIKPVIPIFWEPGKRVKGEGVQMSSGKGADLVYAELERAKSLRNSALAEGTVDKARIPLLKTAAELDYITPRIKGIFIQALRQLAQRLDVLLVDVEIPQREDDGQYFIDYCHPVGEANLWLAQGIFQAVASSPMFSDQTAKREQGASAVRKLIRLVEKINSNTEGPQAEDTPNKTYTLW